MHNFSSCDGRYHETAEIHYEEEIEIDYSNIDESMLRDAADQFICCPKCHCHPSNSLAIANQKCSALRSDLAAAAAALLPPGNKKLPASTINHLHCLGHSCFNHKHPNHRSNLHQVKMRLQEKSKKKQEEKQNSEDSSITLELSNNTTNQDSTGSQINQSSTNPVTSTAAPPVNASKSRTIFQGSRLAIRTFPMPSSVSQKSDGIQKQRTKGSHISIDLQVDEDLCTKKDDCDCPDCLQRQKIAEELIAEEESSKKKKQKKKKNKNKMNKVASDAPNEDSKTVKNKEIETPQQESVAKPPSPSPHVSPSKPNEAPEASNKSSKKNKKNKQQNQQISCIIEPEITATSITSKESNSSGKRTKENNKSVSVEQDPTSVDIHQWIKVKNKNKIQNLSPEAWNSSLLNQDDERKICEDEDAQSRIENSSISSNNNGFKMIQNDKRRMSSNEKSENFENSNDGSRMTSLNPVGMAPKAKLLAIEAQIAFNKNELKGAVQYISEALELDPNNPVYYINRAFYHERLSEYEHALKDCDSAMRFDETKEYLDHILCLNAKALAGMKQYQQAESKLMQIRMLPNKPSSIPFIEKDLLLLRLKSLVSAGYTLPLARLYASKFSNISEASAALERNCQILVEEKMNDSDLKLHLMLITNPNQREKFVDENHLFDKEVNLHNGVVPIDSYDDDEIYFSDDEERDILYADADNWNRPKDILKKSPAEFEDAKEPPNSKGQKALWIGNVSPTCSLPFVTNLFMKFGNVTFCKIFPNEQRTNDLAYLLLHYDNDISPRLVMSYFKDKVIPGISKDSSCPLIIRFRNKNDKADDNSTLNDNFCPTGSPSSGQSPGSGMHSPSTKSTSECYYWRTTGCDRHHCTFRHVAANKGVDKQAWMRKKN